MVVSARDVAAALRARLPGLGRAKVHKLLYYCQGHHLATFGEPLFRESVSAWDLGPVVGEFWFAEENGAAVSGSLVGSTRRRLSGKTARSHARTAAKCC